MFISGESLHCFLVGVQIKSYSNLRLVTLISCFQAASLTHQPRSPTNLLPSLTNPAPLQTCFPHSPTLLPYRPASRLTAHPAPLQTCFPAYCPSRSPTDLLPGLLPIPLPYRPASRLTAHSAPLQTCFPAYCPSRSPTDLLPGLLPIPLPYIMLSFFSL